MDVLEADVGDGGIAVGCGDAHQLLLVVDVRKGPAEAREGARRNSEPECTWRELRARRNSGAAIGDGCG